jgi:hypothetical protein
MQSLGEPSLKAIAAVFELNPVRIYTVAKQPREGEIYDRNVFNWDAIERFVEKRFNPEKALNTFEDVVIRALEIDQELKSSDGRRASNKGVPSNRNTIEVDGKNIQERRFPNFEMAAGQPVVFRKDPAVYAIVIQTKSHTVLRPVAQDGSYIGEDVKVASNGMMNWRCSGPATLAKDVEDRFSGKYAADLAAEAAEAAAKAAEKAATDKAE